MLRRKQGTALAVPCKFNLMNYCGAKRIAKIRLTAQLIYKASSSIAFCLVTCITFSAVIPFRSAIA